MRLISALSLVLGITLTAGCGGGSSGTNDQIETATTSNWFVTSPDKDLSLYTGATLRVTFSNDHPSSDMTFNTSPQFQLWSHPDVYDFTAPGDVIINSEPSGIVNPGGTFAYDLEISFSNLPSGQVHLAIRPVDNNLFGTILPNNASVVASEVVYRQ